MTGILSSVRREYSVSMPTHARWLANVAWGALTGSISTLFIGRIVAVLVFTYHLSVPIHLIRLDLAHTSDCTW